MRRCEAKSVNGWQTRGAFSAPDEGGASETIREGASTCSTPRQTGTMREKNSATCQNVHKVSTARPHVFHSRGTRGVCLADRRGLHAAGACATGDRRDAVPHFSPGRDDARELWRLRARRGPRGALGADRRNPFVARYSADLDPL